VRLAVGRTTYTVLGPAVVLELLALAKRIPLIGWIALGDSYQSGDRHRRGELVDQGVADRGCF
jgi:hypothetical protein